MSFLIENNSPISIISNSLMMISGSIGIWGGVQCREYLEIACGKELKEGTLTMNGKIGVLKLSSPIVLTPWPTTPYIQTDSLPF